MKDVWKSTITEPPTKSGEYIGAIYDRENNETYTIELFYACDGDIWVDRTRYIKEPLLVYAWMPMPKAPAIYTIGSEKEDVD